MYIFVLVLLEIELLLGIYLNVKKIKRVKKDKQITWELEFYHSIICITYLGVCTIADVLDYKCHDIKDVVGIAITNSIVQWIKICCQTIVLFHSFSVAIYKYYVIIHSGRVNNDDKNMEKNWLILLVILPLVWTCGIFTSHGTSDVTQSPSIMCNSRWKLWETFCNFNDNEYYKTKWTLLYIITNSYCIIQFILTVLFHFNIIEGLLYFKIFQFMKRYLSTYYYR